MVGYSTHVVWQAGPFSLKRLSIFLLSYFLRLCPNLWYCDPWDPRNGPGVGISLANGLAVLAFFQSQICSQVDD